MPVVSVSMPEELLERLDAHASAHEYTGRSEVVRESTRALLEAFTDDRVEDGALAGTVDVRYDVGTPSVERRVAALRHEFDEAVAATDHSHVGDYCPDLFVLEADRETISSVVDKCGRSTEPRTSTTRSSSSTADRVVHSKRRSHPNAPIAARRGSVAGGKVSRLRLLSLESRWFECETRSRIPCHRPIPHPPIPIRSSPVRPPQSGRTVPRTKKPSSTTSTVRKRGSARRTPWRSPTSNETGGSDTASRAQRRTSRISNPSRVLSAW
ncbi:putative transcriptional regulator with CopG/Arc/MetJ DNA-binding domain and metal-binding domain [Natronococcus occultus SP4]|uniref:Putative transcriptional regulator with CopG/Arc/MetJ DNA-binding domain and metal-binding domain n=1 Tax=Natronococcus occultus SP4 TaxID=694430 RepID=L0JT02_9EURY|nr:putative transcriptional regulator with CopG/Arc/MetJ DNA-binding domain and metal-binding domain [Natronococcus occultus SP4]